MIDSGSWLKYSFSSFSSTVQDRFCHSPTQYNASIYTEKGKGHFNMRNGENWIKPVTFWATAQFFGNIFSS